ncbi:multi antimicrobial extrusion protein MatE [Paenibacillus darwinianus]|nr:multi antimicrobial extrusion protein MatE [Paenibacillus darwinianus]
MPSEQDERTADARQRERVPLKRILAFFVPLGLSASLVSLSHVIINGTLARTGEPEAVIAAYAIAMSIFTITERPAVFLRQTCSALAADRTAFRAVGKVTAVILFFTMTLGLVISYTPAGRLLFTTVFNADETMLGRVLDSYRILIFVTIFSAVRCLYHGIIIRNMHTKWLTIGMLVRLCVMYFISLWFVHGPYGIDGRSGAIIFLAGMLVEAVVSFLEGRRILRGMPEKQPQSNIRKAADVLPFYRPLVVTSFISVIIGPAINAMLGKTTEIELAIASYAVALSITNIVVSFYTYVHQIVLNFYREDSRAVRKFALMFNLLPAAAIAGIAYSPIGPALVGGITGGEGPLLNESLRVLRVFVLFALLFPWVDYGNGLVMLHKRTRYMAFSQLGNVGMTVLALVVAVTMAPSWNGHIGALAQSFGLIGELLVLVLLLRRFEKGSPPIATGINL